MHSRFPLFASIVLVLLQSATASSLAEPAPEATAIIEQLGLEESKTAMSDHPGWSPTQIAVMHSPRHDSDYPGYKESLHKAAGNAELLFFDPGDKEQTTAALAAADAIIGYCSPAMLKQVGPNLQWIHHYFVGMDACKGQSKEQLEKVVFTNNKRLSGPPIAEHTIAMLLSLTRNLPTFLDAQRQSKFRRGAARGITFGELRGKTMLVVGLGGIGTEIAWRAHGLGMRVIATRRSSREGPEFVEQVGSADELHELAAKADVIANALPLTAETTGIFNKSFFEATKPGAIFLSVGRGKSTVTADLIAALESGKLYGAGLDVTDPEPLPKDSPLWSMSNVIITPHIAAAGAEASRRSLIIATENLRRYVAGEPLLNVVNIGYGY